jgi:hypothetical protein
MFLVALFGSPAVVVTIAGWLPADWSTEQRGGLAIVLAVPVVVLELLLALLLLVHGANAAGPGLIE